MDGYTGGTCLAGELNFYAICSAFCGVVMLTLLYLRFRSIPEEEKAKYLKPALFPPVVAGIYTVITGLYATLCSTEMLSQVIRFQWTILPLNMLIVMRYAVYVTYLAATGHIDELNQTGVDLEDAAAEEPTATTDAATPAAVDNAPPGQLDMASQVSPVANDVHWSQQDKTHDLMAELFDQGI